MSFNRLHISLGFNYLFLRAIFQYHSKVCLKLNTFENFQCSAAPHLWRRGEEGLAAACSCSYAACNDLPSCDEMIPTPEPPSLSPPRLHIPPSYNAGYCLTPAVSPCNNISTHGANKVGLPYTACCSVDFNRNLETVAYSI